MSLKRSVTVPLGGPAMALSIALGLGVEPPACFGDRKQPDETRVVPVPPRPVAPLAEVRLQHPPEQRVTAPEGPAPALAVAAPELDVVPDPLDRPPPQATQLQRE